MARNDLMAVCVRNHPSNDEWSAFSESTREPRQFAGGRQCGSNPTGLHCETAASSTTAMLHVHDEFDTQAA